MRPSLWHRIDLLARNLTPFGLTLVLLLLGMVPLQLPGFAAVAPALPLMAIYHWTIYRPELMPTPAVFLIGVIQDSMVGGPFGIHALLFLLAYGAAYSQRRFFVGKSFPIVWLGFALLAAGVMFGGWILVSSIHMSVVDGRSGVFQFLVSLGLFPLLSWAFSRWQQAILKQD